jgi:hypothetical protein
MASKFAEAMKKAAEEDLRAQEAFEGVIEQTDGEIGEGIQEGTFISEGEDDLQEYRILTAPADDPVEEEEDRVTFRHNGREATITGAQLQDLADRAPFRPAAFRQRSMFLEHPEMDEHARIMEQTVKSLASDIMDRGGMAAVSTSIKRAFEWLTPEGMEMIAVVTMKMETKPKPVKAEE